MSTIKNLILCVVIFVTFNIHSSPTFYLDSDDDNLANTSPRRFRVAELIAPIARRSSITSHIISALMPALPAMAIQPTLQSPPTNRRHPASFTQDN